MKVAKNALKHIQIFWQSCQDNGNTLANCNSDRQNRVNFCTIELKSEAERHSFRHSTETLWQRNHSLKPSACEAPTEACERQPSPPPLG